MEKPADAQYSIHELLRKRWSPVAFSERLVPGEHLCSLLEAARWAPSCYNDQPWHFLIATKEQPEDFNRLLGCLVEANVAWARHAPVLMLTVARLHFAHNEKVNRHAWHDIGLAVGNLLAQATSLGILVHQMAGFSAAKAREVFGIPEDYEPITAIALGYPGNADRLPEALRQRHAAPRTRRPLEQFVYSGAWGRTSPLVRT
jgi:nitroreductase